MKLYEYVIAVKDQFSRQFDKLRSAAGTGERSLGRVEQAAGRTNATLGRTNQVVATVTRRLALMASATALFAFTSQAATETANWQSLENAIRFASGSVQEGNANMQFVRQTATGLGLDIKATAEGFKIFSGAMMGSRLEGQATRDIFSSVAKAGAVMGLSTDQVTGAFLALGQIQSKGKVQAEELRGQLGERIPGAFQIAARAMGVTTSELDKMLERGQVMAEDFLPKFAAELERTFGSGVERASQSFRAQMTNMGNALTDFQVAFGTAFSPVYIAFFSSATEGLNNMAGAMQGLRPFANILAETLTTITGLLGSGIRLIADNIDMLTALAGAYGTLWLAGKAYTAWQIVAYAWMMRHVIAESLMATVKGVLTGATLAQTAAQWGLNAAMLANPVGLVIVGLTALAGAFYVLWQRSETFRAGVMGLWEMMKEFGSRVIGWSKMIFGVFLLNKEMVDEGRRQAKGTGQTLAEAFAKGYKDRLQSERIDKEYEKFLGGKDMVGTGQKPNALADMAGMGFLNNPFGGGASATGGGPAPTDSSSSSTKAGMEAVTAGNKTINVTVNMGSAIENLQITSQNLDEGLDEMQDKVRETIARILNGAVYSVETQ